MPISEDDCEVGSSESHKITMSKTELRKTHKPIMEKRRRARINQCLNEIKSLILEAMNKDPARHSKLEKADILEMAVKHLQNVQKQQLAVAMATDPTVLRKFKTGFNECANEIDRFVSQAEGINVGGLKDRMKSHLQKCINGLEQVAHFNFPAFQSLPFVSSGKVFTSGAAQNEASSSLGDQNNNARVQIPSIQLIPSRLPSGEIALLVPNSSNMPFLSNFAQQQVERPSAFAAVIPSSSSPLQSPARGFRPVQPSKSHISTFTSTSLDEQVSSTSTTLHQPLEVKPMRFPIHNNAEVKISPKKPIEPLCIITNQSERFKQAQTREDAVDFEENRQQGIKRKFSEISHQGLLTTVSQDYSYLPLRFVKTEKDNSGDAGENPSTSRGGEGTSNDAMWRPW